MLKLAWFAATCVGALLLASGCSSGGRDGAPEQPGGRASEAIHLLSGGVWTEWWNRDAPGGNGDFEDRALMSGVCAEPLAIEAQTGGVDYRKTGEALTVSPQYGLSCRNSEQPDGRCQDYKVRFYCPVTSGHWSPWSNVNVPSGADDSEPLSTVAGGCARPMAFQAETVDGVPYERSGEVVSANSGLAFFCQNQSQPDQQCQDYRVRVFCADDPSSAAVATVPGFADLHLHMMAEEAFGGRWLHGRYNEALTSCDGGVPPSDHARLKQDLHSILSSSSQCAWPPEMAPEALAELAVQHPFAYALLTVAAALAPPRTWAAGSPAAAASATTTRTAAPAIGASSACPSSAPTTRARKRAERPHVRRRPRMPKQPLQLVPVPVAEVPAPKLALPGSWSEPAAPPWG